MPARAATVPQCPSRFGGRRRRGAERLDFVERKPSERPRVTTPGSRRHLSELMTTALHCFQCATGFFLFYSVFLCLSVSICIYISFHVSLFATLCVSLYECISLCLSVSLVVSPSLSVSMCLLCVSLSFCVPLYIYVCLALSLFVSLCISMCVSLCICIALYHFVSICIALYHLVYLCIALYHSLGVSVSLCVSLYIHVSLCVSLCPSLSRHTHTLLRLSLSLLSLSDSTIECVRVFCLYVCLHCFQFAMSFSIYCMSYSVVQYLSLCYPRLSVYRPLFDYLSLSPSRSFSL